MHSTHVELWILLKSFVGPCHDENLAYERVGARNFQEIDRQDDRVEANQARVQRSLQRASLSAFSLSARTSPRNLMVAKMPEILTMGEELSLAPNSLGKIQDVKINCELITVHNALPNDVVNVTYSENGDRSENPSEMASGDNRDRSWHQP